MNTSAIILTLLLSALVTANAADAAPTALPQDEISRKLATLEEGFQAAFQRDAGQAHTAAVARLNNGYSSALDRAMDAASKSGKLEEAVLLRDDKARMTDGRGIPPADLDNLPATLKQLRLTYRTALAKLEVERDQKASPLFDRYDQALTAYQTELTTQKKLDEALRVKAVRDEITKRRGASTAPIAATELPPANTKKGPETPKPNMKSDPSSVRRAAEWVFGLGGNMLVLENGSTAGRQVTSIEGLPKGRFSVIAVTVENKNKVPEPIDLMQLAPFVELKTVNIYSYASKPESWMVVSQFKELHTVSTNPMDETWSSGGLEYLPPQLTTLRIYGGGTFAGHGLAKAACKELLNVGFHGTSFDDDGLAGLTGFKKLKSLLLNNTKVTDAGMAHLAGLRDLEELQLSGTSVTTKGLAALRPLKSMRKFSFGKTPQDATRDMAEVARIFPDITEITPAPGKNSRADIEALATHFPKLKVMKSGPNGQTNPTLDDECFAALGTMIYLEVIETQQAAVTDAGLKPLQQLKMLNKLTLRDTNKVTDGALDVLKECKSLRLLTITGTSITETALADFRKARPDVTVTR